MADFGSRWNSATIKANEESQQALQGAVMLNEFPEATARLRDPRSDHDYYQRLKETVDALPDNLTDQEADAILQEHGTSAKEVVNGFIEQLLRERSVLREAIEAEIYRQCAHCKNGLAWTEDGRAHYGYAHQGVTGIVTCLASRQLRAALHPQPEGKRK